MFPLISIDYTSKFESECGSARAIISLVVCVTQVICCASVLCKPLMRTNAPDDDWTTRESDRAKHICFDGRLFCAPRTPSSLSDYFKGFSQRGKRHVMVEFLISCWDIKKNRKLNVVWWKLITDLENGMKMFYAYHDPKMISST